MHTKRRYWTDYEKQYLKTAYAQGTTVETIADKLNLQPWQVYAQIRYLNIGKGQGHNRILFSKKEEAFIRKNFHSMTNPQLAKALSKTLTVVRNKCRELGLLHMQLEYWTPEQIEYLKANFRHKGDQELAAEFQKLWPKNKTWTKKHIDKKRGYLGLKRTLQEQFLIRTGRFNAGDYKDFNGKHFPIGKKRIWFQNGKQYWVIKVERASFMKLHIHNWIKHRGPIPKGMKLRFKDGNTLNWKLSNMELVSQSQLAKIISDKNHTELSDSYVAAIIAFGGNNRNKIDRELKAVIMQNPQLIEAKRQSILLNRNLKQQKQ